MQEVLFPYSMRRLSCPKPEADGKSGIDLLHDAAVRVAGMLTQAALINGSDLLKQNDRVLREAHVVAGQRNVRRQARLAGLAGNGGGDDCRRMLVAGVVLHDEHKADTRPARCPRPGSGRRRKCRRV